MKAGPLNTILDIRSPIVSRDAFGSYVTEWSEARAVRAEEVRVSARSLAENEEEWPDYSPVYRVNIAHRRSLAEGMRLTDRRDPTGRVFVIRTIVTDRPTASLLITADRVNE